MGKRCWLRGGLALVLIICGPSLRAEERDWASTLKGDATALHATYLDSHPGAVDSSNPGFRTQLQAGLETALRRATTAGSDAAYLWAMREYVAGLNDGHVYLQGQALTVSPPARWPGFLTRERAGAHVVAFRSEAPGLPPLGARLLSCDGVAADGLVVDRVGRFWGRWNLDSQRDKHAWRLFLDAGNPYAPRPARCVFAEGAATRGYDLRWTTLTTEALAARAAELSSAARASTGVERFGTNGFWVSAGSFGAQAQGQGEALEALVTTLKREQPALAAADVVVLDVRGNGGGSSRWGDRIAAAIWGSKNAAAAKPRSAGIDWRPSAGNIAAVEAYAARPDTGFFARLFFRRIAGGLKTARAAGQPLWREKAGPDGGSASLRLEPVRPATRARVFVLADGGCASACLDALDVWTRLGAVVVGRETGADSLYMEVRDAPLPSGLLSVSVPMKVYRGRPRGLNQTYRPTHAYSGDMRDRAALERWILTLAATTPR